MQLDMYLCKIHCFLCWLIPDMKVADKIPNPWLIRHCILKNLILHSIMNSRVIDNTDHLNTIRKNHFCRRIEADLSFKTSRIPSSSVPLIPSSSASSSVTSTMVDFASWHMSTRRIKEVNRLTTEIMQTEVGWKIKVWIHLSIYQFVKEQIKI